MMTLYRASKVWAIPVNHEERVANKGLDCWIILSTQVGNMDNYGSEPGYLLCIKAMFANFGHIEAMFANFIQIKLISKLIKINSFF